ncbi:hypothetical protein LSTR_LSTR009940 [Laodelphax striatellus]|uniref:Uncharacterized protein n=1 Tax=Laodelphax striatellus TaxID=195883 RepID=A0A482X8H4_LAOST|nr:hypothetical protein LSTR_LSTR009940 [Laodelphax striatellus]
MYRHERDSAGFYEGLSPESKLQQASRCLTRNHRFLWAASENMHVLNVLGPWGEGGGRTSARGSEAAAVLLLLEYFKQEKIEIFSRCLVHCCCRLESSELFS